MVNLIGAGVVLLVRAFVGVVIALQVMLGMGLALAARATGMGRRYGRVLHVVWAILALLIELPLFALVASYALHWLTVSLLVLSFVTAAYALVILALEPILVARDSETRAGSIKKPKPILGDFA